MSIASSGKNPVIFFSFLLACSLLAFAQERTSTIVDGHVRFQFLTPSLVRLEFSSSRKFVDAPTVIIQKRDWSAIDVKSSRVNGWLEESTSDMTIRYKLDSGPFTADNLVITWHDSTGSHSWHPGKVDSLNLGGLTYSLDNINGATIPEMYQRLPSPARDTIPGINVILPPAQPGLLSLNGYAFINDSRTPIWNAKLRWIEPRKDTTDQDWYLFVYGRDYKRVLTEYAELSGRIPMIPRYTLGPWITDLNFEYFPGSHQAEQPAFKNYNEQHLKDEILKFRNNDIPLDIFVFDFGWHNYAWEGGFDWSPLIPKPKQFLNWLHDRGVRVSLNDHPGYVGTQMNILSYNDSHIQKVLKDLGMPVPPKPTFNMDLSIGWKFSTDTLDQGISQGWFARNFNDKDWRSIEIGVPWQDQGYKGYHGVAWYRTSVSLPTKVPDSLYLYLGAVWGTYQLYINGTGMKHSVVQWPQRLTYSNITSYVNAGQQNEIAVRIVSEKYGGGITAKPVAIEDVTPPPRIYFDLSNEKQAKVFMDDLHKPLMQQDVDFWWVDGGSGSAFMPGLNPQLWTNRVYYDYTQKETNKRGFIFSRYGGWGSQRYPAFFTGDTHSEWAVLAYEVPFTATGGNVLMPYITHDIGGFQGDSIPFDLYARWIEFGTFSPILRLHSAYENPYSGNVRMPWTYGSEGMSLAKKYFTLRIKLIPYIYTYTREAYEKSMPLVRPLYLKYPDLNEAYLHPHEYFFGNEMLVAPIIDSTGSRTIYLPPGNWIDFFTGKRYDGDTSITAHYDIDETPVFVREGAIIPEQQAMAYSNAEPLDTVSVNIYGSENGRFNLYEDDGVSLKYKDNQYSWTPMRYSTDTDGSHHVVIGPTKGSFDGQVQKRSYHLQIHSINKPQSVLVNGKNFREISFPNVSVGNWKWDAGTSTAVITLPEQKIREEIAIYLK